MNEIGWTPEWFGSWNTCQHRGRVFNFTLNQGKLVLTEALFGEAVEFVELQTQVDCRADSSGYVGCCDFGDCILVMAGRGDDVFAVLVAVRGESLREEEVSVTTLAVEGDREWPNWPFLCQVSESRALLQFDDQPSMWYCEVASNTLTMTKQAVTTRTDRGFGSVPIRLSNGELLVAGSIPESMGITRISCLEEPRFEHVGNIPGVSRCAASAILLGARFLVGFGGWNGSSLYDLWIYDLLTHKASPVRKDGAWHPKDYWVPLAVREDTLYLIGGNFTGSINAISLATLSCLILNGAVRSAFRLAMGFSCMFEAAVHAGKLEECPFYL